MAVFFPSNLLKVGIAQETTYGVGVAPALWLPVDTCVAADNTKPMPDAAWRGPALASFGYSPGSLDGSLQLGGPFFADGIGFPLLGILGDIAHTGVSAPFTWTFAELNGAQPPSFTINTYDPSGPLTWTGCLFSDLSISFNPDDTLGWIGTAQGISGASTTPASAAYTAPSPMAGWRGVVTLGGAVTATILDGTVAFASAVRPVRNSDGTRTPYTTWSGITGVSGTFTAVAQTDAFRAAYVAGTATSIDMLWTQGAGAALNSLQVHCTDAVWTKVSRLYGTDWVELDMEWTTAGNTTDTGASGGYSPVKVTVKNAVAPGIY